MGVKIIKTCDRCGCVIDNTIKTYKNINNVYQETATKDFMRLQLKDGYKYNLMVNFNNSKWQPNVDPDPKYFPDFNGFVLCKDCLEELEKFLMNEVRK